MFKKESLATKLAGLSFFAKAFFDDDRDFHFEPFRNDNSLPMRFIKRGMEFNVPNARSAFD